LLGVPDNAAIGEAVEIITALTKAHNPATVLRARLTRRSHRLR
jgi:hypothetical protein